MSKSKDRKKNRRDAAGETASPRAASGDVAPLERNAGEAGAPMNEKPRIARREAILFSAVFLVFFALYAFTAAPNLYWGDSSEFLMSSYFLGVSHPSGYAVFNLLCKLFSFCPFETSFFGVNLMSAFISALALCVMGVICIRFFPDFLSPARHKDNVFARFAALLTAISLVGLAESFWDGSGISEVGPVYVLEFLILLYLLIDAFVNKQMKSALALILVAAVALSFHVFSFAYAVPAAGLYVLLMRRNKPRLYSLAPYLFLLAVGTAAFIYVPLRTAASPPYNWGVGGTPKAILDSWHIYGKWTYTPLSGYLEKFKVLVQGAVFEQFSIPFLVVSFFGCILLFIRSRREWFLLAGVFSSLMVFMTTQNTQDYQSYMLPADITLGFMFLFGIVEAIRLAQSRGPSDEHSVFLRTALPALIFLLFVIPVAVTNFTPRDKSRVTSAETYTRSVLTSLPDDSVLYIFNSNEVLPLLCVKNIFYPEKRILILWSLILSADWYRDQMALKHPELHFDDIAAGNGARNGNERNPPPALQNRGGYANSNMSDRIFKSFFSKFSRRYRFFTGFYPTDGDELSEFRQRMIPYGFLFALDASDPYPNQTAGVFALDAGNRYDRYTRHTLAAHELSLGAYYMGTGQLPEAARYLEKSGNTFPDLKSDTLNMLGFAYAQMHETEKAKKALSELARIAGDPSGAYFNLALIEIAENNEDAAEEYLEKTIEINPDHEQAIIELAKRDAKMNRVPEALSRIDAYIARHPDHPEPYFHKAVFEFKLGHVPAAEASLLKYAAADGTSSKPYIELAYFYRFTKHPWKAVGAYKKALERTPKDSKLYVNLGSLYDELNRPEEAEKAYREALAISPRDNLALANLAYINAKRVKNLDAALEMIRTCVRRQPQDPGILDILGFVYYQKGDFKKALKYFNMALPMYQKPPPELLEHINQTYKRLGLSGN